MVKGAFIVIEGTDGSGKTMQFKRLTERLTKSGVPVATFDFPQYGKPSAYFVEQYLNKKYGGIGEIGPYKGSVFYAVDRYDASFGIRAALHEGKFVVSNRYVGSNMGHQGSKMQTPEERKAYFEWLYEFEYKILGIPQPDVNIMLHMPAEQAQQFVDLKNKEQRAYAQGAKRDLHEEDLDHLKKAEQVYLEMCTLFPDQFTLIESMDGSRVLTPEEVHEKIWEIVSKKFSV